jgi:hypothetical protein
MESQGGGCKVSEYDSKTKLEALRDHFEDFSKGTNYLVVGHAAGCLSVVKEHPDLPPPLQQVDSSS